MNARKKIVIIDNVRGKRLFPKERTRDGLELNRGRCIKLSLFFYLNLYLSKCPPPTECCLSQLKSKKKKISCEIYEQWLTLGMCVCVEGGGVNIPSNQEKYNP